MGKFEIVPLITRVTYEYYFARTYTLNLATALRTILCAHIWARRPSGASSALRQSMRSDPTSAHRHIRRIVRSAHVREPDARPSALDPREFLPRALLARLLTLALPRVALHEARRLKRRPERSIQALQCGRNAMANRLRLATEAATRDGREHTIFARGLRLEEGRKDRMPVHPVPAEEA